MPSESERREEDRAIGSNEAQERLRGDPVDRPNDLHDRHPAERDGSLRQRLASLQAQAPVAAPMRDPPPALGLPGERQRARKSILGGLLIGFGASIAIGLLLAGGMKWEALLAALQTRSKSTVELYPAREIDKAKRVTVASSERTTGTEPRTAPKQAVIGYVANANVEAPCEGVLSEVRPGILQLRLVDTLRSGNSIIVKIGDFDYRATFGADGHLILLAPHFSGAATARWLLPDGTPCSRSAPPSGDRSHLRIALVWGEAASLTLHIVEPSAWLGAPTGDISASTPNLGHARGAGEVHSFGQPNDPTRVQLYIADKARLGQTGVLSAVVTLQPSLDGGCTKAGAAVSVRYQLYALRPDSGSSARPEIHSLAFELPPCDQTSVMPRPVERIPIRF